MRENLVDKNRITPSAVILFFISCFYFLNLDLLFYFFFIIFVLIFQFVDGLWKAGNPDKQDIGGWAPNSIGVPYDGAPNEEFWGIVDIERNKKKTFEVIKNKYNNN